jgi:hypothetical protein
LGCLAIIHAIYPVGTQDTENFCLDTSHIGIYVSSKSQRELFPKVARWLKERDREGEPALPARADKTRGKKPGARGRPAGPRKRSRAGAP